MASIETIGLGRCHDRGSHGWLVGADRRALQGLVVPDEE